MSGDKTLSSAPSEGSYTAQRLSTAFFLKVFSSFKKKKRKIILKKTFKIKSKVFACVDVDVSLPGSAAFSRSIVIIVKMVKENAYGCC